MAYTSLIDSRPELGRARLGRRPLPALIPALLGWLAREWRVRRDVRALMEMNEAQLADIGVSRAEIITAVRHGRPPRLRG